MESRVADGITRLAVLLMGCRSEEDGYQLIHPKNIQQSVHGELVIYKKMEQG